MTYSKFLTAAPVIDPVADGTATLVVDETHPFFYDHPVDHVPGMLLLTGLLDLLGQSTGETPGNSGMRLALRFVSWCELDQVRLSATSHPDSGRMLTAEQNGEQVCTGTAQIVAADCPPGVPSRPAELSPVSPQLVHRTNPANVMLYTPRVRPDSVTAPLLAPPAGHFLRRHDDDRYAMEEVVEAARQLMTFSWHAVYEQPLGIQLVWLGLAVDLVALPSRDVPLTLRWEPSPVRGRKMWFDMGLFAGEQPLGSLNLQSMAVDAATYERLRGRKS